MKINMIDISEKKESKRTATASGTICLKKSTVDAIKEGKIKKGDPLTVSEIAAITAVKETPRLIPLCHNIPISKVDTGFQIEEDTIKAQVTVASTGKTGAEMEALAGLTVCLLNIWDMVKYLEKDENGAYPTARLTGIKVTKKKKEEI